MLVIVVPVVAATVAAVLVLTRLLDVQTSTGRLEMIRTALAVGAGTGAVMTLVLAWRRQWSTEHDAAERRLTELYVKAVEQLGSDKAAVRHGALYALERVAQDNPGHRQTVVDVICAYLRAPFTPPPDKPGARKLGGLRAPLRPARPAWQRPTPTPAATSTTEDHDRRQEREVRLTAQRILRQHLQPHPPTPRSRIPDRLRRALRRFRRSARTFWPDVDLDLTGATLIDLDLIDCAIRTARFTGATFTGNAEFSRATFTDDAGFGGATFTGDTVFSGATFTSPAWFDEATFTGTARFDEATFTGDAGFGGATFTGDAGFSEAIFASPAWFSGATFTGTAWFSEATFTSAWFEKATFSGTAWFNEATFTGVAWFEGAAFTDTAQFRGTTFTGNTWFNKATFTSDVWFGGATLPGTRYVDGTSPSPCTSFDGARFARGAPVEITRFVSALDDGPGEAAEKR
ncbi:Pentapeptide repeat-containing protein [Actinokineospora iranica]|uniref:Pentapeptide repeat-containing protein n=1 Tax=Actinokineospora iranica TaxID=1271860 RepID=A0A1G6VRR7_9PSEU|nr:Pentapeptide repeat-containing protein [Actinokineospora iranica]